MTEGRHLMLYSSCRRFLASVLKRGEDLRAYPRELFVSLANDGHPQAAFDFELGSGGRRRSRVSTMSPS